MSGLLTTSFLEQCRGAGGMIQDRIKMNQLGPRINLICSTKNMSASICSFAFVISLWAVCLWFIDVCNLCWVLSCDRDATPPWYGSLRYPRILTYTALGIVSQIYYAAQPEPIIMLLKILMSQNDIQMISHHPIDCMRRITPMSVMHGGWWLHPEMKLGINVAVFL